MFSVFSRNTVASCVVATAAVLAATPALAQFPGNQPLTMIIASGPGGGYDAYGRLAARHVGRYLPGNPSVVPKNMPGAGSIQAANWLYNVAPKDGTAIGILQNGTAYEPLLGNDNAKYDGRKFNWLISLNRLVNVALVWHATPFTSAQDLFEKEVLVGGTGASNPTIMPNVLNNLIGTKFKVINGYSGTTEVMLAMERGELHGLVGTSWDSLKASKPDWVAEKKMRILMQVSFAPHPELEGVASVMEFIKNDEDKKVLELFLARQEYGRPFVAPPGTSAEVVTLWRNAFTKMSTDSAFLADADKMRAEITVNSGDEIAALVNRVYDAPRPIVDRVINELRKAGG